MKFSLSGVHELISSDDDPRKISLCSYSIKAKNMQYTSISSSDKAKPQSKSQSRGHPTRASVNFCESQSHRQWQQIEAVKNINKPQTLSQSPRNSRSPAQFCVRLRLPLSFLRMI